MDWGGGALYFKVYHGTSNPLPGILRKSFSRFTVDQDPSLRMNVENVVGILQDEQMGKIIDLYV